MLSHTLHQHLTQLRDQGLYRQRLLSADLKTINFSSNDYLSLTSDPRFKKAYQKGFELYPSGSGGSMLVSGYHPIHQTLEQAFAKALNVDNCVLFSSGYAANLGVTNLLGQCKAHVLIDKSAHASIYDGLKLSGVAVTRYLHNHLPDLALKIRQLPENSVLMTESVFSMSGQKAPLNEIAQLGQTHGCDLLVDEAHAFGIFGREGLGAIIEHQLTQEQVPLRVIPFGKAYASCGAIVAGKEVWIDALLQSARSSTYSTAISPAFAYGLLESLETVRHADDRRYKLTSLITYFQQAITQSSLKWRPSNTPIQQLQLGCPHRALSFSSKLREQGIICAAMRQPTTSKLETGLRVILNYHHHPEDIDKLFKCLHDYSH